MIIYSFPCGPLETNAILIACSVTKVGAVIDPALGSTPFILKKTEELGIGIQKIILTHSHWDHFADAAELQKKTKAPLYVHPLDAKNIENPGSDGIPLFFPIKAVRPDYLLKEQESLSLGLLHCEIIHTPGHSPGSVCLYFKDQKVLISGDTLFRGSIGTLNLPTATAEQMWPSLEKLSQLPAETRVLPGHGRETTIGQEHWLKRAKEIFSEGSS